MPKYIDRDIALSHPFANGRYDKENANEHFIFGYEGYKEWLEQLPTIDAEPMRHGHWVENNGRYGWYCSQCKKENNYAYDYNENNVIELQDHYCPNCGAKMDEE